MNAALEYLVKNIKEINLDLGNRVSKNLTKISDFEKDGKVRKGDIQRFNLLLDIFEESTKLGFELAKKNLGNEAKFFVLHVEFSMTALRPDPPTL